jgi:hypothetical protein
MRAETPTQTKASVCAKIPTQTKALVRMRWCQEDMRAEAFVCVGVPMLRQGKFAAVMHVCGLKLQCIRP